MKDVPIPATTSFAKTMMANPKFKKEIQLIYNAKANPLHPVIWKKIYETFGSSVQTSIMNSGSTKFNLTREQLESELNAKLKEAVMDYDINNPQGANPTTFISIRLYGYLSKLQRAGRMASGTEKKENDRVLVNKIQNILRSQNKPSDAKGILEYLQKRGYNRTLSDIQSALAFNVRELSGSQLIGGDEVSGNGGITYQELIESKQTKTLAEIMDERNKLLHAYNNIYPLKDKEFIKAAMWIDGDKLGLGQPIALIGAKKPSNFKELCGIYKIGHEKGKKIYLAFLRAAGNL